MKFLTEEECKERISNPNNLLAKVEIKKLNNGGRRRGDTNIPPIIRELAGTAAHMSTAKEVASAFGISPIQTHALKHGMTSVNGKVDENLKERIDQNLGRIKDQATEKLLTAMGLITDEEIGNAKLLEKSAVAKDMASIIEKVSPKGTEKSEDGQSIHFHIYGPKLKDESSFEAIDVQSREIK